MSKFISSKNEYLETLMAFSESHGISADKIHVLSTTAYQTFAAQELYEMVSYSAYIATREMFPATAMFRESIMKWNKIANANILQSTPSSRYFYLEADIDDIMAEAVEISDRLFTYTIKAETEITIDKTYTYSLDYDLILQIYDPEGLCSVTARYDMDSIYNPISKVVNPNMKVIKQNKNITVALELMQYKRVNKSFRYIDSTTDIMDVDYTNQLVDFVPYYRETEYKEYPIRLRKSLYYDRLPPEEPTIYYSLKEKKISLVNRGYRGNFRPAKDSLIELCIFESYGTEGNFEYIGTNISMENIEEPIPFIITVTCDKDTINTGLDEDTLDDIRRKTLESIHTRDSLISEHDLNIHFSQNDKVYKVIKTRDDMMYRVYSIYVPLKYNDQLVPSNTIDVRVDLSKMIYEDGYYKIPENATIYSNSSSIAEVTDTKDKFKYMANMLYSINHNARIIETYEKFIDRIESTEYEYTFNKTRYTFMINRATLYREPNGPIKIKFVVMTNLAGEVVPFHEYDESGNIVDTKKVIIDVALERTTGVYMGYVEAKMVDYREDGDYYEFEATIDTDFFIRKSEINLELRNSSGVMGVVNSDISIPSIKIIVRDDADNRDKSSTEYGVPEIANKGIVNVFSLDDIDIVKNYTDISGIHMKDISNDVIVMRNVPLFGYDYVQKVGFYVFKSIYNELDYINSLYLQTQTNFVTNVKFVNTYGVSRLHLIGNGIDKLDSTNIKMKFRVGLTYNTTVEHGYIKDYIVNYFNNVDFLNDETFHVSDLIYSIRQDIPDITKFEFVSINGYNSDYQFIHSDYNTDDPSIIPEIVSFGINTNTLEYDIELIKI